LSCRERQFGLSCYGRQAAEEYINMEGGDNLMEAYCVKCKAKREMKDPQQITMKNGKPATQGTCPVCGTKMFKIGAAK
jgi:hypothetical protein